MIVNCDQWLKWMEYCVLRRFSFQFVTHPICVTLMSMVSRSNKVQLIIYHKEPRWDQNRANECFFSHKEMWNMKKNLVEKDPTVSVGYSAMVFIFKVQENNIIFYEVYIELLMLKYLMIFCYYIFLNDLLKCIPPTIYVLIK